MRSQLSRHVATGGGPESHGRPRPRPRGAKNSPIRGVAFNAKGGRLPAVPLAVEAKVQLKDVVMRELAPAAQRGERGRRRGKVSGAALR